MLTEQDLNAMSIKAGLRPLAKSYGITGLAKKSKADLIDELLEIEFEAEKSALREEALKEEAACLVCGEPTADETSVCAECGKEIDWDAEGATAKVARQATKRKERRAPEPKQDGPTAGTYFKGWRGITSQGVQEWAAQVERFKSEDDGLYTADAPTLMHLGLRPLWVLGKVLACKVPQKENSKETRVKLIAECLERQGVPASQLRPFLKKEALLKVG